ncbi:outer membrane beta-barrel protein [Phyllobacterium sp. YR531]|uniref:outer membrane beta-barrel protein n=1 Tax=Phyllobacterium sp. YR531 TaxID=1144343 RepID=UPI0012F6BD9C|nr:outer membrane beta-barrel protein [Phyllobacterium sp. YR531]
MTQPPKQRVEARRNGRSFRSAINACMMSALLGSTVLAFCSPASAQQTVLPDNSQLRGPIQENAPPPAQNNRNTRPTDSQTTQDQTSSPTNNFGIPSRPYEPVSPGALPADDDSSNLGRLGVPANDGSPPSGPSDNSGGLNPPPSVEETVVPVPVERVPTPAPRPGVTDAATADADTNADRDPATLYETGAIEQSQEGNPPERRTDKDNMPVSAIERRTPRLDPEPFAPLGIRAGTVTLRPSISQGLRATTNADNSSDGKSAVLSETRLRARATTDWSRHSAWMDFDGTYDKTISGEEYSAPNIGLRAGFQLDLGARTTVTGEAGYRYRQEDPSAPTTIQGTSNRPGVQELDGSLGVRHEFGKFFGDLKGKVNRTTYGNAEIGNTTISQKDRDNTFASIALRGGFEMSPAIKPFAEVEIGKLIYDEKTDFSGYRRSGLRTALRGGVEIDFGEKMSGEFALGYLRQGIDDDRLQAVEGLSADAAIKWSPQRGTDVDIGLLTRVEGATTPGESGSVYYEGTVGIKRQVRANLDLNAKLIASLRDNKDDTGLDKGFGAEIGATYWFNRFVGLDVSARHQLVRSDVDSRNTDETSIYVGVTLQR